MQPLMQKAWRMGKSVYVPTLFTPIKPQLRFAPYKPGDALARNRFDIAEPIVGVKRQLTPMQLDLVLMPLVGFDLKGNRLGMGGGFYDRSFAYLHNRRTWRRPRLVGIAYEFQKLEELQNASWDVPMDAVATELAFYPLGKR